MVVKLPLGLDVICGSHRVNLGENGGVNANGKIPHDATDQNESYKLRNGIFNRHNLMRGCRLTSKAESRRPIRQPRMRNPKRNQRRLRRIVRCHGWRFLIVCQYPFGPTSSAARTSIFRIGIKHSKTARPDMPKSLNRGTTTKLKK